MRPYEHAGTTMLALGVPAVGMVAGWLYVQSRKVGLRPEDLPDAVPQEADIGYFPASSVWPFICGAGVVVAANALVFGVVLAVLGGLLLLVGVAGYAAEASSKA